MNNSTTLASQDPTLETQGPMYVYLNNQTDMVFQLDPTQATLGYGSSPTPPPVWVQGKDWQVLSAALNLPPWQYPQSPTFTVPTGSANVIGIANRGTSSVAARGEYVFDQQFFITGTRISMHFTISGVSGGSTVLPGFGLWNLGSNPGAWTYVTPTVFDGSWSIQLRSPDCYNLATLSVSYVPYGWMNPLQRATSRLFYSVAGSGSLFASVAPFPSNVEDKPACSTGEAVREASSIEIVRASGEYRLLTDAVKQKGANK
jgi:hypothetical protein